MSMRTWTRQGFGFKLFNGNNFEQVKNFTATRAMSSTRKLARGCETEKDLREAMGGCECTHRFHASSEVDYANSYDSYPFRQ